MSFNIFLNLFINIYLTFIDKVIVEIIEIYDGFELGNTVFSEEVK